jgi:two-component system response regulator HydG
MKLGAFDFITKPFPNEVLRSKSRAALELIAQRQKHEKLERMNEVLREEVEAPLPPPPPARAASNHDMVGTSRAMQRVLETIRRVAHADSTVYIYGESGTGKELVARAVHRTSRRKDGPFIKVNCGALAESLLESELFGHEKGSFTNAIKRKLGRFELADGGTLFLDEIGDISPHPAQALRVLQERESSSASAAKRPSRSTCASSAPPTATCASSSMRASSAKTSTTACTSCPSTLPPLRDRLTDIDLLAEHFLVKLRDRTGSRATQISEAAKAVLRAYPWPGNVRELENCIEQSLVFCDGDILQPRDMPAHVLGASARGASGGAGGGAPVWDGTTPLPDFLDELEKKYILQAWEKAGGVKTRVAEMLGVKPSALYYKLEKYGIGS